MGPPAGPRLRPPEGMGPEPSRRTGSSRVETVYRAAGSGFPGNSLPGSRGEVTIAARSKAAGVGS